MIMNDESHFIYIPVACVVCICLIIFSMFAFNLWDFPFRVNCWFCNNNDWVQFIHRNSWTCQKCQQYNGFSSDGGYNKSLQTFPKSSVYFNQNRHPPHSTHNGLCHNCNTNQQLKVRQLAHFKPMNEKNFDQEVEAFNSHLDDVYKLCHDCQRFVNNKLQSEKGNFLVKKKTPSKPKINKISTIFNTSRKIIAVALKTSAILMLLCVSSDIFIHADLFLSRRMVHTMKQYFINISNTFSNATTLKDNVIISSVNNYWKHNLSNVTTYIYVPGLIKAKYNQEILKGIIVNSPLGNLTLAIALQFLSSTGLLLQGLLYVSEFGLSLRYFINVIVWSISFYISNTGDKYLHIFQLICAAILIMNTTLKGETKSDHKKNRSPFLSKKMKNLSNFSFSSSYDAEMTSDDSDSDIGRNRTSTPDYFQIKQTNFPRHFSEGKNHFPEQGFLNNSFYSSQYDKNIPNSLKNYDPYISNPHSVASGMSLWQRNVSAHDLDLDESISTLNLGKKSKMSKDKSFEFSTRNYNSPNVFMPSPAATVRRPVLSPSRFNQGAQQSWVAGGYWGVDSPRQIYNLHDTSRSSSQSSGFESLTSGYRNGGTFLPFRDESVAGEYCKKSENVFHDGSVYSSFSRNPSAFQSFSSAKSTIQPSVVNSRPLFFPHSVPYDCSTKLGNLNLLNSSFLTPNPNHSFKPLEKHVPNNDKSHNTFS